MKITIQNESEEAIFEGTLAENDVIFDYDYENAQLMAAFMRDCADALEEDFLSKTN